MTEITITDKQESAAFDKQSQGEEKRKRRTRNDEDGRNFTCACGKSYLSYPALYTHIKTKHNGKVESVSKIHLREENQSADIKDEYPEEQVEKIDDYNNIQTLKTFLLKFFPFTQKEKDQDKRSKEGIRDDQNILKTMKDYWQKRKKEDQPHQNETYSTSIDYVLGKFLLECEPQTSRSCQKYLSQFILDLRLGINQLKQSSQYCSNNNAAFLPSMMNDLFLIKFQTNQDHPIYTKHPTILCKTIYHFARWLYQERFTNQSLKFNSI